MAEQKTRRGLLDPVVDAYNSYIGRPFASVAGGAINGYLGFDRPTFANEQVYRTAQALSGMPGVGAPAGIFKAAANAPEALVALGGLLGKTGVGKLAQSAPKLKAPQDQALEIARKNAVKMLGLPENNTAMDRAKAMGFDDGWYHGTTADIRRFSPEFRGESTGAASAKKADFFAKDPVSPPAHMMTKAPANSEAVNMLRNLGIPEAQIAELNTVSMKGHGANTASGYASIGGGRDYKDAMRRSRAAEKAGNWNDYEKWMQVAEDSEIARSNNLQDLVAKYGDARDVMLDDINKAIYSKQLPQGEADALDARVKQLMPYGWYNSYSTPQIKALRGEIAKISDSPDDALSSIDRFLSLKAQRQAGEKTQYGSNVMPVMIRSENPMSHDFGASSYRDETYSDLIDKATLGRNDVLFLRNTYDPGGGPAELIDVAAVTKPALVRSRFAAFDPARINENDLLGFADPRLLALIGAGTGGGLLGYNYLQDR